MIVSTITVYVQTSPEAAEPRVFVARWDDDAPVSEVMKWADDCRKRGWGSGDMKIVRGEDFAAAQARP